MVVMFFISSQNFSGYLEPSYFCSDLCDLICVHCVVQSSSIVRVCIDVINIFYIFILAMFLFTFLHGDSLKSVRCCRLVPCFFTFKKNFFQFFYCLKNVC